MTMSEYLAVLKIISDRGLIDQPLKVYTKTHDFTGYALAEPQDGVVYFSSELPVDDVEPLTQAPGSVYTCVGLEAIGAIELTQPEPPPVLAPVNVDVPLVMGDGVVGQSLTCTMGNWDNEPTSYSYAWMRDADAITDATADTYTIVEDDVGHSVGCIVTATNSAASVAAPRSNDVVVA